MNKGKIFIQAAIRALIAGAEAIPGVGVPVKMGRVFYEQWVAGLKAAQDALPEAERPAQLAEAGDVTPEAIRSLATEVLREVATQGVLLSPEQQEAVTDLAVVLPARIRERTRNTLQRAKHQGTAAYVALPVSNKVSIAEREEFYQNLLPLRRSQYHPGDPLPHGNPEWELVELLGSGGFGEVWLTRHDFLAETRAVKFCQDQTGAVVLRREAANLQKLRRDLPNHPHIVRLHDLQLKREPYWLTFEHCAGGTLESLIRAHAQPWPEAAEFLLPVFQAMAQVHNLGIVHRDLKPANILLDAQGCPKVGDFGIGKIIAETSAMERKTQRSQNFTTTGYGSLGYMSPEQEAGEPAHPADDTYALGVILWQMVAGTVAQFPIYPDDIQDLNASAALKSLLTACRFTRRAKRPANARELLQLLGQVAVAVPSPPSLSPIEPQPPKIPQQSQSQQQPIQGDIKHGHYLIHPDGTVTDTHNGLMWKRCAEGQTLDGNTCVGDAKNMTWDEIMPGGKQKRWPTFAGYSDWRVPSREELRTLVYCSSGQPKLWNDTGNSCQGEYQRPTIDITVFPNTPKTLFWSSSPSASFHGYAWVVNFADGDGNSYYRNGGYHVRLVRGGQ